MDQNPSLRRRSLGLYPGGDSPRLHDRLIEVLRTRHCSPRTEEAYVGWIARFVRFHEGRHPCDLSVDDVNAFVSDLATRGKVAASTQNQALAAILFLYREVLETPLGRVEGIVRARRPKRVPVVLTRDEVELVLSNMTGTSRLVCALQYGSGLGCSKRLSCGSRTSTSAEESCRSAIRRASGTE